MFDRSENEDVRDSHGELYSDRPPFGVCEGKFLGCEGIGERVFDPYAEDIAGEKVWIYLCDPCYGALCLEI